MYVITLDATHDVLKINHRLRFSVADVMKIFLVRVILPSAQDTVHALSQDKLPSCEMRINKQ